MDVRDAAAALGATTAAAVGYPPGCHPTAGCNASDERCGAWDIELDPSLSSVSQYPTRRAPHDNSVPHDALHAARNLAAHWLRPFEGRRGIRRAEVYEQRTYTREEERLVPHKGVLPGRECPLVMVRGGKLFIAMRNASNEAAYRLTGCSDFPPEKGRLLVMLRLLLLAITDLETDFDARVCFDDFCHGLYENRSTPLPFFTMVACRSRPSLPFVQWNTFEGRDPDLAVWPAELAARARQRAALPPWAGREATGVWRGSLGDFFVANREWSSKGVLAREPLSPQLWRSQGRLALLAQRCARGGSELLNVRIKLLQARNAPIHTKDFAACVAMANKDHPRAISLAAQAERFRYVVHVEGNGGWADRLRHLLLSGAVVLKQEMGVVEWFEPLLQPWVHYVPVSSDLGNLSDAVRWARVHDVRAQRMPAAAAATIERALSTRALLAYVRELVARYARLYARGGGVDGGGGEVPEPPAGYTIARFTCEVRGGESECFVRHPRTLAAAPGGSVREIAKMDAG